jgi:tetratricopeptide (TPR) repeat protein
MFSRRRLWTLPCCVAFLVAPMFATAQDAPDGVWADDPLEGLFGDVSPEDARHAVEFAEQARAAYEADDIGQAIGLFEQAFDLSHDPGFAFNLGALYEAVGELPRARAYFEAYLELYPDAPNAGEVADIVSSIDETLQAEWVMVNLDSNPVGASVFVVRGDDEFLLGTAPLSRWLRPGEATFRFRTRGWQDKDVQTVADLGGITRITGQLEPRSMRAHRLERRCSFSRATANCGS